MNADPVDLIARTVLYEGYLLYPYRPSAVKNRQRFTFGVLYPPRYSQEQSGGDLSQVETQCPVEGNAATRFQISVRFLQLVDQHREGASNRGTQPSSAKRGSTPVRSATCRAVACGWYSAFRRSIPPRPPAQRLNVTHTG